MIRSVVPLVGYVSLISITRPDACFILSPLLILNHQNHRGNSTSPRELPTQPHSTQPPRAGNGRADTGAFASVPPLLARPDRAHCTLAILLGLFVLAAFLDARVPVDSLKRVVVVKKKQGRERRREDGI